MSFLGMVVFTRMMSKSDYGMYSTYYAYVSVLTVLVGANLYYPINNAYIDYKDRIHEYRKTVLVLSSIVMAALTVVFVGVSKVFLREFATPLVICGSIHAYSFFVVSYRVYSANMENDYKKKAWLLILPNALQFFISLAFMCVFSDMSFTARVIGSTIGVFLCACVSYAEMMCCKGKAVIWKDWKYALAIALPSIVMSLSYMLMQQCDKVMITNYLGNDETAVYSVIYYLGYAIIAIDQAVSEVRHVWVYKRLDENNLQDVRTIQKWYLIAAAVMAAGIFMLAPEVIRLIAPKTYWEFEYVIPFVCGACMMILYRFYTEVALFYKKNALLSVCVLVSALVNIGLNTVFIPRIGAVAAAYTTVVAYFLLFVLSAAVVERSIKRLYSYGFFLLFILYMGAACCLYASTYDNIAIRYPIFGCMLLSMAGYVFRKRTEWKKLLRRK